MNDLSDNNFQANWKRLNYDYPNMRDSVNLASKLCCPGIAYLEIPAVFLLIYYKIQQECNIVQLPNDYWSVRLAFRHARANTANSLTVNKYHFLLTSIAIHVFDYNSIYT